MAKWSNKIFGKFSTLSNTTQGRQKAIYSDTPEANLSISIISNMREKDKIMPYQQSLPKE
jgi:hypothetical protein